MRKFNYVFVLCTVYFFIAIQSVMAASKEPLGQTIKAEKNNTYPGVEWRPAPERKQDYPGVEWQPAPERRQDYPGVEWQPKPVK